MALQALPETGALCQHIAALCELWWTQERPGKDQITPQTLSFLLVKALDQGSKIAGAIYCHSLRTDIARLYEFRGSLLLMDFGDER